MVDHKKEMDDCLFTIKMDIRQAQLQTNRYENGGVDEVEITLDITEYLRGAKILSKDVPPIGRMVDEVLTVWELISAGDERPREADWTWLVGCTFAIIAALDYFMEADP